MEIEKMKPDLEDLSDGSPLWLRVGVVAFLLIYWRVSNVGPRVNEFLSSV